MTEVLEAESGEVTFTAATSSAALATLVRVAAADSIEVQDITVSKLSLEQVFLRLTGRAPRD